jgi:hypothetical protein
VERSCRHEENISHTGVADTALELDMAAWGLPELDILL